MDIRVISLKRTPERREHFNALNAHLDFTFFDAIDGELLPEALQRDRSVFAESLKYRSGAIGCALSHRALWQECAASDQPLTIAEDDAVFRHDFPTRYPQALAGLPLDWDFVLWGWNFDFWLGVDFIPGVSSSLVMCNQAQMRLAIPQFQQFAEPPRLLRLDKVWGIPAYTMSPRGARRFLAGCFPLKELEIRLHVERLPLGNTGIDSQMNQIYPETLSYVAFPPLVVTPNEHARSTIQVRPRKKGVLSRTVRKLKIALRGA